MLSKAMSGPLKCCDSKRNNNGTIAVSSRAMSRVPVTRRKMIKMLMILSRDRSNHTIIYVHIEEEIEERGRGLTESRCKVSAILKRLETYNDQTHGETCVFPVSRSHFGSKSCPPRALRTVR